MIDVRKVDDIAIFDMEITPKAIEPLLDVIHKMIKANPKAKMLIYFSSIGGSYTHAELFIEFLNQVKDNVVLVAFHQISSAGFKVFYTFEGEKYIMNHCFAIVHEGTKDVNMRDLSNKESFDFFMTTNIMEEMRVEINGLYRKYLTNEEMTRVIDGKDVYLNVKRLREILKLQNKE